jgi:hypothetical protein
LVFGFWFLVFGFWFLVYFYCFVRLSRLRDSLTAPEIAAEFTSPLETLPSLLN